MDLAAIAKQALKKQDLGDWKVDDAKVETIEVNLHKDYIWVRAWVGYKIVKKEE